MYLLIEDLARDRMRRTQADVAQARSRHRARAARQLAARTAR